jgi:hypothetical protein
MARPKARAKKGRRERQAAKDLTASRGTVTGGRPKMFALLDRTKVISPPTLPE